MLSCPISRQSLVVVLVILSFPVGLATLLAQTDVSAGLARAESLFYRAQFEEAIALLLDLEKRVGNDPQRQEERLKIKLILGSAYLGLDETERAKAKFVEVCGLDGRFTVDPRVFPSKVVALFEEAKASCTQDYCGEFCGSVSTLISEGKLDAAQNQLQSANSKCSCAAAAAAAITAARFGQAKDLYDRRRFAEASKEFTAMLALDPTDQVARGYLVLSRIELELVVRQAFSDWRENFDSRQYDKAAAAYELIRSSNVEPLATQLADLVTFEYQTALSVLVRSWKDACTSGDRTKMDAIKKEAVTLASGAAIDPTALGDMGSCVQQGCFHSDPVLAINRLKTRVSPQIEPALQRYISRGIRVDIQIDESGNVKVKQIANANPRLAEALKSAIEQWKFYPAIVDSQPRCVETELPIAFVQP